MENFTNVITIPIAIPFMSDDMSITCDICKKTFNGVNIIMMHTQIKTADGAPCDRIVAFDSRDVCEHLSNAWMYDTPYMRVDLKNIDKGLILN